MQVIYVTRDQLGLPPVGTLHNQRGITKGYPYAKDVKAFTRINVHHTVIVMGDWDHDGYLHGDMDDIRQYMKRLMTIREADLGPEVPYSFVIFEHPDPNVGIVAEGRGWGRVGAHTQGENSSSYGASFAGNTSIRPITPGMIAGVRWVGINSGYITRETLPHSFHKSTACPGNSGRAHLPEMQPPFQNIEVESIQPVRAEVVTLEITLPVLHRGTKSVHVRKVQSILNILIGAGLVDDGDFGPATEAAIKRFQGGLRFTNINGIVDADTWRALMIVPT